MTNVKHDFKVGNYLTPNASNSTILNDGINYWHIGVVVCEYPLVIVVCDYPTITPVKVFHRLDPAAFRRSCEANENIVRICKSYFDTHYRVLTLSPKQ